MSKDAKRNEIQQEAVDAFSDNNYHGIVLMAPRVGKTRTMLEALNTLYNKQTTTRLSVLWVAPFIDTVREIQAEVRKWGAPVPGIQFETTRALDRLVREGFRYSVIVVSEVHTLSDNQRRCLSRLDFEYILAETGTLSDRKKINLKAELGLNLIYDYSIEQAIADELISNYEIYIVSCELEANKRTIDTGKGFSVSERQQYNYLTSNFVKWKNAATVDPRLYKLKMQAAIQRANFLYKTPSKISLAKQIISCIPRCLIYTARIEVAETLSEFALHSKSPKAKGRLPKGLPKKKKLLEASGRGRRWDTSTSPKWEYELTNPKKMNPPVSLLQQFKDGKINKLALINMASMSVTFPNLKDVVIHQVNSNEERLVQRAFRACNREEDKIARAFLCRVKGTRDAKWIESALKGLNPDKVRYVTLDELYSEGILQKQEVKVPHSKAKI